MMPGIQEIFYRRFKKLRESWGDGEGQKEWKTVDLYEVLGKCFDDIVHITMLGETEPEKIPKISGHTFSHAIEEWLSSIYVMLKQPLHTLSFGLTTRYVKIGLYK
jgi:hypothetical protein